MGNLHGLTPPPKRVEGPNAHLTLMSMDELDVLAELLGEEPEGDSYFEIPQLMWLANQPPEKLPNAEVFYAQLELLGFRGFVPIDNWRSVMGNG